MISDGGTSAHVVRHDPARRERTVIRAPSVVTVIVPSRSVLRTSVRCLESLASVAGDGCP